MLKVKTAEEIEILRANNLLVSKTLGEISKMIKPGVTTLQLDKRAEEFIRVLENNGVPVTPKFGGVLEVDQGEPRRFTDAISYKGTSIDPLEIFASKRMTSYLDVLESGSGLILANVREIPVPSRSKALDVIEDSRSLGLAGVLKVGCPGGDLYGLPVGVNRVGIAIAGGINSAVAVEESGIEVESRAMEGVFKFSDMALIDDYL